VYTIGSVIKAYSYFESDYLKQQAQGGYGQKFIVDGTNTAMTILSGGNVGINTTSPSKTLEVNGSFKLGTNSYIEYGGVYPYTITTANTAAVGNLVFSAGLGSAAYESRIDLQGTNTAGVAGITLSTASTARMVITADGDVGIGTTTPLAKLDIQGTQGQLFSVTDDLSGSIFAVSDISGVPIFDVNSSGVSYFDGTVEIGTSTVATANAAADDLWLRSTGSNGITISSGNAQTGTIFFGDVANAAAAGFRYNHNTGDMAISAEDNITFACDNVGIGTTSPGYKLDVAGDIYISNSESLYLGSANSRISSNSSSDILYFPNRDHIFGSVISGADVERMRITEAGNVGIGNTNPSDYSADANNLVVGSLSGK